VSTIGHVMNVNICLVFYVHPQLLPFVLYPPHVYFFQQVLPFPYLICFLQEEGVTGTRWVWELDDVPLVVGPLRWFFCLLGHEWILSLCSLCSLFFLGCFGFGLFMIGGISTLFLSLLLFLSCPIVIMSGECEYPFCIFAHNHLVFFFVQFNVFFIFFLICPLWSCLWGVNLLPVQNYTQCVSQ